MRLSVLVPTYRRPADFERCLQSLDRQLRTPDEVLVVLRDSDTETQQVVQRWQQKPYLRVKQVTIGGQVNALNAGLDAVTGDIVMITDDDAAPHDDWCQRVEQHFADNPDIGGVGGRDIVYETKGLLDGYTRVTGRVRWWGQLAGNHHLIAPRIAFIDILKGANMSYRKSAIGSLRFDMHLRGAGAQVGNDMAFSMAIAAKGWRLVYDPAVQVDHYPATRFDNDMRGVLNLEAVENTAFNLWWTLRHPLRRVPYRMAALSWELVIGTSARPGCLRGWLAFARRNYTQHQAWKAAHKGRQQAEAHRTNILNKSLASK